MKGLVLAAAILAAVGGAIASWPRGHAADSVPSLTVRPVTFVRRVGADGTLRAVTATPITAPMAEFGVMKLAWLAPEGAHVAAGDIVARLDPTAAAKALREAQAELDTGEAELRVERIKATQTIAEADAEVAITTEELVQQKKFQATDPVIFSRNQILEADLDANIAVAHQNAAKLAARIDRSVTRATVEIQQLDRDQRALARDRAKTALADMDVHAPHAGILVLHRGYDGELPRLGAEVSPNQELANLPDVSVMEAEVLVLELDGDGLAVGQPVDVTLASRPGSLVRGTIRVVDKVAKPRTPGVPIQYFSVVVQLPVTDRDAMKPAARVHANIVLADKTAIVVPRQAVVERGGRTIVYRRDLVRGFAPVAVTLGAATSGRVVIASGLVEGDVIALRDPTETNR